MKNRLEISGVVLEGRKVFDGSLDIMLWTVDGEPMKNVRHAVEIFFARIYPNNAELPREFIAYQRRMSSWALACPRAMVRRARGDMTQAALAKASGVAQSNISRIESGSQDPKASTLFNITHAAAHR